MGLIYIGETGAFRQRVRHLLVAIRNAKAGDRRHRPPHVAGACVFAHVARDGLVEISWAEVAHLSKRDRKGTECELIAAYRQASGHNPTCQFAGELDEDGEAS